MPRGLDHLVVPERIDVPALRAGVDRLVVLAHRLAQHCGPGRLLGDDQLPARAGVGRRVDPEPAVARDAVLGALLRDHERAVGIAGVEREREAEARRADRSRPAAPSCRRRRRSGRRRSGSAARAVRAGPGARAPCARTGRPRGSDRRGRSTPRCPRSRGCQVAPPSSDRKTPAAEIPIQSCCASSGSSVIECVISPPAPGDHFSRVSCPSSAVVHLPARARVVGAEEHARLATEPERPRLGRMAGLEMPRRGELEPALLGQAEALRALPRLARGRSSAGRCRRRPSCSRRRTARRRAGRRAAWLTCHPGRSGPSTSNERRSSSPRTRKRPFRVPITSSTPTTPTLPMRYLRSARISPAARWPVSTAPFK